MFQDWLYPSSLVIGDRRRSGIGEIKAEGISGFDDVCCSWIDRHLRLLASITYRRAWDKARSAALTPIEYASPLGRRVYDLRHACVFTWLNGGVPPAQVAGWAGHSVAVLLRVYAKCIDGQDQVAKRRIEEALREPDDGAD